MVDVVGKLLDHAVRYTWAKPHIDFQFLLKPRMVTGENGTKGPLRLYGLTYYTPDNTTRWLLYEFGAIEPRSIGWGNRLSTWRRLDEVVTDEEVFIDVYINRKHLPLSTIQIVRENDGNFIFAIDVEKNKDLLDVSKELYIRIYSNHYFTTPEGQAAEGVRTSGGYMDSPDAITTTFSDYNAYGFTAGLTWWFHNGYYVERPPASSVSVGDTLFWIHTGAGVLYYDLPIDELPDYISDKDNVSKFIVRSPEGIIDDFIYHDDVDFYICSKVSGSLKGVYYDRREEKNIRQVTLKDWALESDRVYNIIDEHPGVLSKTTAFIRVFMKKSVNPILDVSDGQYIRDFYRLDFSSREHVLRGDIGAPEAWTAANLEKSPLMEWIPLKSTQLNEERLKNVFSYYGLQKITQFPTLKTVNEWDLPVMGELGCLVIELDIDGYMLSMKTYTEATFTSKHITTTDIKDIVVYCGEELPSIAALDLTSTRINDTADDFDQERFYKAPGDADWTIAKFGTDYTFNESTGTFNWNDGHYSDSKLKRSSRYFKTINKTIAREDIGIGFSIFEGGIPESGHGFGRADVWIRKYRAVPGLDYIFDGFTLTITNRAYLGTDENVEIFVVAHGLPSDTDGHVVGFIYSGMTNYDDKFDLINDRNYTLFISGKKWDQNNIWQAEDYRGELSFTVDDDSVTPWSPQTYPENAIVSYDGVPYVAPPGGVPIKSSFTPSDWQRLWESTPLYVNGTTDRHVLIYRDDTVLKQRKIYENATEVNGVLEEIVPGTMFTFKPGLPLYGQPDNGSPYVYVNAPRNVPRQIAEIYSEGLDAAKETTATLAAYIKTLRGLFTLPGIITVPGQHAVVSPFMRRLINAIQDADIVLTTTTMSDALVDYTVRNYLSYLENDPMYNGDIDKRFVSGHCHAEITAIGLNVYAVEFLNKVNNLYFNGAINVTTDVVIV